MKILIVEATIRRDRKSILVARYLQERAARHDNVDAELLDLKDLDLPVLWERRHWMDEAEIPAGLQRWHEAVVAADAIIFVVPEYNGGYPAAFKNAFDALYSEYQRKPIGIATVSVGMGGVMVEGQLRQLIAKVKAVAIPTAFLARNVASAFDDAGHVVNEHYERGADSLIAETIWYAEAIGARRALDG